jgi:transposase
VLEQGQLLKEPRLLREHFDRSESEIVTIVEQAREGQILLLFPGFRSTTAVTIIAAIGSIHNYPSAPALKSYFGWGQRWPNRGVPCIPLS